MHAMSKVIVFVAALALPLASAQALVTNGGFETGDFSGWTTFTTSDGTLGPAPNPLVESFDTDNDLTSSLSARFQVGRVALPHAAGGGIFQTFTVSQPGLYDIGADIAAFASGSWNSEGGVFSLLINGSFADAHDFGDIDSNSAEHAQLFTSLNLSAGNHELRIQMTRPWTTGTGDGVTPYQYIDDVFVSPVATAIPTPAALPAGLFAMSMLFTRRRQ
jgi:uncharacterized protein (TIGR03382 family)